MTQRKSINIEIGQRIKAARERRGMTQEVLAELLNVTPHFLSAVERGVTGISLEKLRQTCLLLQISGDYILFGADNTAPAYFARLSAAQKKAIDNILINCMQLISHSEELPSSGE